MCGIAGIFHCETPRPVDPARVETMANALAHRGPDGSGVWTDHGVGLGHRRLSIIDLEGSPQPMHSADDRVVIAFNGEIYNYRELRAELSGLGARFKTEGDTETILAAWQQWGIGALDRLDGMFAFALYDRATRKLLLARDRLGVKPIYMARLSDGGIAFASELKGVLAHPLFRPQLDPLAIEDYMTWGYVPDHRCILKGVEKLGAGHYRLLEQGKPAAAPVQWWDVDFSTRARGDVAAMSAELMHTMRGAVTSRMVSDVPLGAFLSGGVDSSSVVALMAETSANPVQTCSIGFDVASEDESDYARKVAQMFGTDHHSQIVSSDQFDQIDRLAGVYDEPFADASALPTLRVCELARKHVNVALSGDGADEAFAGYRRQVFHRREDQLRSVLPAALRAPVFGTLAKIWPKADWAPRPLRAKSTFAALSRSADEAYASALAILPPDLRLGLYTDSFRASMGDYRAEQPMLNMMANAPARSALDRAQYADLKFWLPGDILTKVDRASMAVGLEAREPLLDHRLIEFGARLPEGMRVKGAQGKWLLKHSMEGTLPQDILYRPKQGFVTPIAQWLRGPLAKTAEALSRSGTLNDSGIFDSGAIARLAQDHIRGRRDNARPLWQLIMLEKSLKNLGVSA